MASQNILIIDDDQLVLMNYTDILEDTGYVVTQAATLAQGMSMVTTRDFELVVCDHDLPDGKGMDIVRRLAQDGKDAPVIYLSAALPSILEETKALPNVRAVLSKPIEKDAFLETVRTFAKKPAADSGFPRLIGDEERNLLLGMEDAE